MLELYVNSNKDLRRFVRIGTVGRNEKKSTQDITELPVVDLYPSVMS